MKLFRHLESHSPISNCPIPTFDFNRGMKMMILLSLCEHYRVTKLVWC